MEAEAEQVQRLSLQLETLKKDKSQLLSQLTAHVSLIEGLRAEKKLWSQELAQQGGRKSMMALCSRPLLF